MTEDEKLIEELNESYYELAEYQNPLSNMARMRAASRIQRAIDSLKNDAEIKKIRNPEKPACIDEDFGIFECPNCHTVIEATSGFGDWHFCLNCGQAIDLSEVLYD